MKKLLACGAALSLMLLACGDDSSSGPDPVTGGATIESSDSVVGSSGAQAAASSAEEATSSAEVATSSAGGTAPESSAAVPESSSSVIASKQEATDIVAQCGDGLDENAPVDVEIVDGPGGTPPVAYAYIGDDGFITYVVESMMLSCGIALDGISASAEGDTVFAELHVDPEAPVTNCICNTRVSFKVKKDDNFTRATHLVIDRNNVFDIVSGKEVSVWGDKLKNKVVAGQCMNDDVAPAGSASAAPAPEALPTALLGRNSDVYYIEISRAQANCGIGDATMKYEQRGDTLFADYSESSNLLRCVCIFDDLKFIVPSENIQVNYFSFGTELYTVDSVKKN
jgi:hypothetical protein